MMFKFQWKPKAKDRPRARKGGRVYTPRATADAEQAIKDQWPDDVPPLEGPVSVTLRFSANDVTMHLEPVDRLIGPGKRGDLDNYCKLVLDALNGVAWIDDKQIVRLEAVWK